jgi:DNA-binding ferritin-like protein
VLAGTRGIDARHWNCPGASSASGVLQRPRAIRHAAELTTIERPPDGAEPVASMLERLLDAHETVITKVRRATDITNENADWGSNDLLMVVHAT